VQRGIKGRGDGRCSLASLARSLAGLLVLVPASMAVAASPAERSTIWVESARSALLEYLARVHPELSRVELEATSKIPAEVAARAGGLDPVFSVRDGGLARRMCVWVKTRAPNQDATVLPVWFALKAYQRVWVATRSKAAHQLLEQGDLALEERDVAPLGATPLSGDAQVTGWRARRALAVNRVVLRDALEAVPPITRGADVEVLVHYGAVHIQTRAVALQDGRLGDQVRVQNPNSLAIFIARVVGDQRVWVGQP